MREVLKINDFHTIIKSTHCLHWKQWLPSALLHKNRILLEKVTCEDLLMKKTTYKEVLKKWNYVYEFMKQRQIPLVPTTALLSNIQLCYTLQASWLWNYYKHYTFTAVSCMYLYVNGCSLISSWNSHTYLFNARHPDVFLIIIIIIYDI
jgi:hypothetical protein